MKKKFFAVLAALGLASAAYAVDAHLSIGSQSSSASALTIVQGVPASSNAVFNWSVGGVTDGGIIQFQMQALNATTLAPVGSPVVSPWTDAGSSGSIVYENVPTTVMQVGYVLDSGIGPVANNISETLTYGPASAAGNVPTMLGVYSTATLPLTCTPGQLIWDLDGGTNPDAGSLMGCGLGNAWYVIKTL